MLSEEFYRIKRFRTPTGLIVKMRIRYKPPVEQHTVLTSSGKIIYTGQKSFYMYILSSTVKNKTYVGVSDNIHHRLRQHNGEITGGAASTRVGRPWRIVGFLNGFTSREEALRFEWRMHKWNKNSAKMTAMIKNTGRCATNLRGLPRRLQILQLVLDNKGWRKDQNIRDNIINIFWYDEGMKIIVDNFQTFQYFLI